MLGSERKAVGVADGTAAAVIIEVDVHIFAGVPKVSETPGPIGEGCPAVRWSRIRSALMKPHICPICCAPERGLSLWGVAKTERRSVLLQNVRNLVGVPGFVARLERHSDTRRKGLEGGRQAGRVPAEVRGKLQQNRSHLVTQSTRATEQPMHWFRGFAQMEHMSKVATRLEAELKVLGRRGSPTFEGCLLRQAVEDVIDLDRLEAVRVVRQPFPLRQASGI